MDYKLVRVSSLPILDQKYIKYAYDSVLIPTECANGGRNFDNCSSDPLHIFFGEDAINGECNRIAFGRPHDSPNKMCTYAPTLCLSSGDSFWFISMGWDKILKLGFGTGNALTWTMDLNGTMTLSANEIKTILSSE